MDRALHGLSLPLLRFRKAFPQIVKRKTTAALLSAQLLSFYRGAYGFNRKRARRFCG